MTLKVNVPEVPAEAPMPSGLRRSARWAARTYWWSGPMLAALALGLWQVTQPVLWRDELSSWSMASRSVPDMLRTGSKIDGVQLPYYLGLHYWMAAFGSSVLSMRLPSVLAMAGAAAFVALAARELAGTRAAVTSGMVFAAIPAISRYAQEVRFYALMMLFAALATWLLARGLERPSRKLWVGYAAAMGAMGCMELVAMALLAGHVVWVGLRWWSDRNRRVLTGFSLAAAASVIVCLPVVYVGTHQAAEQVSWVPRPSFSETVLESFATELFYSAAVAVAVLVLAALTWALRPRLARYLTALVLVPLAAVWVVSYGSVSYLYPRYVMFTLIGMSIAAGVTLAALGRRCAVAGVVGLALLGYNSQTMFRQPDSHQFSAVKVVWNWLSYEQVARLVGYNAQRGDGIVFPDHHPDDLKQMNLGVDYYIGRFLRPGVPEPHQDLISKTGAQADTLYSVPCAHPDQCIGDERRIWVVNDGGSSPLGTFTRAEAEALQGGYKTAHVWHIGYLAIGLMIRR